MLGDVIVGPAPALVVAELGVRVQDCPTVTAALRHVLDVVLEQGERVAWAVLAEPVRLL